jgi:acyl carrier protein
MMATTNAQDIEQFIYDGLEELMAEPEPLTRDTAFTDLDIDSLDFVELRQMISDKFRVKIVKDDVPSLLTIGDVIDLVAERIQ